MPLHLSVRRVKPSEERSSPYPALLVSLILICISAMGYADEPQAHEDVTLEQVSYDLFESAQSGHVHQVGPTIAPNAPGWAYLTRKSLGQWRSPTRSTSGRWVSYVEGRGGSIDFPITEEDEGLERLSIWLEPATSRQVLSLFLDEELISNLSLKRGPKRYHLKLPRPLEKGEHRLRLWFRSSRVAPWGGRTAGAVGAIQFSPIGAPRVAPAQWTGDVLVDQQRWGALYAPPPTSWRFYLTPPSKANLSVGAWVGDGPATRFEVRVARDGDVEHVLSSVELQPNTHQLLKVPLVDYAQRPIRLTLHASPLNSSPKVSQKAKVQKREAKPAQVAWLSPQISGHHPNPKHLDPIKVVLMWVIDGLNQDTLDLIRAHKERLPTLARFTAQSYTLPTLWSGEREPTDGHSALLFTERAPPFTKLLSEEGVTTSLITLDQPLGVEIMRSFDHVYEVTQEGVAGHIEGLKHLEEHLSLERMERPQAKHFIYLTSSELKPNHRIKHGFRLSQASTLDRAQQRMINQLALLDYQLMMLLSGMSSLELLEECMVLLVGAPTPHAYLSHRSSLSSAERALKGLEVSALLWHPAHLNAQFTLKGSQLGALSATIAQTLMSGEPSALPYDPLSAHLLNRAQLPPHADRARIGGATVTRLGDYVLYEVINREPSLRDLQAQPTEELSKTHPVTLRALKDALSTARLNEGL